MHISGIRWRVLHEIGKKVNGIGQLDIIKRANNRKRVTHGHGHRIAYSALVGLAFLGELRRYLFTKNSTNRYRYEA